MYQLYIGNKNYSSWSLRPWILMRSLAISFEERLVCFEENSSWRKFRHFSPSGRVPCLLDGTRVIWDSLAVVEYLAERHSGVWPMDMESRTWGRSVACEMHSGFNQLRDLCPMNCGLRVQLHEVSVRLQADLDRIDEIWTEGQAHFGGPWLAGTNFTAVDAFFAPVAFRVQTFGLPLSDAAQRYAEFMLKHPPMHEWYDSALSEPWRETGHEAEVASTGTVTADFRRSVPK